VFVLCLGGALQALQARGVKVPEDVVVAGFDDIEETRAIVPSLTTVRAPWHLLGSTSVDLVLAKLANDPLPDQILLETELVHRQSCGCQQVAVIAQRAPPDDPAALPAAITAASRPSAPTAQRALTEALDGLLANLASPPGLAPGWARALVDRLLAEARAPAAAPSRFLQAWAHTLSQIPSGSEIIEWQELLHLIRRQLPQLYSSDSVSSGDFSFNGMDPICGYRYQGQLSLHV